MKEALELRATAGEPVRGWLLAPDAGSAGEGGSPGTLLILDDCAAAEATAARLLSAGHRVLVPDLNSSPEPRSDRHVLAVLEAGLALLGAREDVDAERISAVGFGPGGTFAYLLGCHSRRLAAVVDVDGEVVYPELGPNRPVQPLEMALNLSCPLLAVFGTGPGAPPPDDVEAMSRVLSQFAREFDIVTRAGDGDDDPTVWSSILAFLDEHIGSS